jgi:hypothetical protein
MMNATDRLATTRKPSPVTTSRDRTGVPKRPLLDADLCGYVRTVS